MAKGAERPTVSRKVVIVLRASAVLVIVCGLSVAWLNTRPSTAKFCYGDALGDEIGAATPEATSARWAEASRGIDIDHPIRTAGSGDRRTATYLRERPEGDWPNPDHDYVKEIVTVQGADGVWRVESAQNCEQWTEG